MNISYEYIDPYNEKYDYLMRVEHLARYLFAAKQLKNFSNVLDVACSNGYGTYILSKSVKNVVGLDRNKLYIDIALKKYNSNNIEYRKLDLDSEEIKASFDGIVCFETIEHIKYPEKALYNFYNILNKDGLLILSFPNSKFEHIIDGKNKDPYHMHVFEYMDIVNLLERIGFNILKVYGQSYTNKIVNKLLFDYKLTNLEDDARGIAYPNEEDLDNTYSYILVLKK